MLTNKNPVGAPLSFFFFAVMYAPMHKEGIMVLDSICDCFRGGELSIFLSFRKSEWEYDCQVYRMFFFF